MEYVKKLLEKGIYTTYTILIFYMVYAILIPVYNNHVYTAYYI